MANENQTRCPTLCPETCDYNEMECAEVVENVSQYI